MPEPSPPAPSALLPIERTPPRPSTPRPSAPNLPPPPSAWDRLARRWQGRTRYALALAALAATAAATAAYHAPQTAHRAAATLRFLPPAEPASTDAFDRAVQAELGALQDALAAATPDQADQTGALASLAQQLGFAPEPTADAALATPGAITLAVTRTNADDAQQFAATALARYQKASPRTAALAALAEYKQQRDHVAELEDDRARQRDYLRRFQAARADDPPADRHRRALARAQLLADRAQALADAGPALEARAAALTPDHPDAPAALRAVAQDDPALAARLRDLGRIDQDLAALPTLSRPADDASQAPSPFDKPLNTPLAAPLRSALQHAADQAHALVQAQRDALTAERNALHRNLAEPLRAARHVDPTLLGSPEGQHIWIAADALARLEAGWRAQADELRTQARDAAQDLDRIAADRADIDRASAQLARARFRLEQTPAPAPALQPAGAAPAPALTTREPNRAGFAAAAAAIAFLATLALGLTALACDDRIRRAREDDFARRAAPLLGRVPQLDPQTPRARGLGAGAVHEARAMIEAASQAAGAQSIAILGVGQEAGATSLAVGVAVSLAGADRSVLLLDVAGLHQQDNHEPASDSVDNAMQRLHVLDADELGLYQAPGAKRTGLPGVLDGEPLQDCTFQTRLQNLDLLASVTAQPGDAPRLSAKRLARILDQAQQDHGLVLIDAGSSSHGIGPLAAAAAAHAVVLVVKRGASQTRVDRDLAKLRLAGANVLGVVFNRANPKHVDAQPAPASNAVANHEDAARGSGIFASAMADRRSLRPFHDQALLDELDQPAPTAVTPPAAPSPVTQAAQPAPAAASPTPAELGANQALLDSIESTRQEAKRLQQQILDDLASRRAQTQPPPVPSEPLAPPPTVPDLHPHEPEPQHLGPVFDTHAPHVDPSAHNRPPEDLDHVLDPWVDRVIQDAAERLEPHEPPRD
ncbi:MAG: hypothetical protein AAF612_09115 [Planctomycetota bacterium]